MAEIVKEERNERGQITYREYSDGDWRKWKYDSNGNLIYYKLSNGYWEKSEYDEKGKQNSELDEIGV